MSMNQPDQLSDIRQRFKQHASQVARNSVDPANERATELAYVVPFIRLLGFNTEDLGEVYPQFDTSPPGGEKAPVDFAIFQQSRSGPLPFILVESKVFNKTSGKQFGQDDVDQLKGYMCATTATYGLLTDGNRCEWYRKPPNKNVVDDRPFLTHHIFERTDREFAWLEAVSKGSSDLRSLERLALRMSLEEPILKWLTMTFENPGLKEAAALGKVVGLKVSKNELPLVQQAAKAVWARINSERLCPPPPGLNYVEIKGECLDLGNGVVLDSKKLKRAWRSGGGQWNVEADATKLTNAVLSLLLSHDARRDNEVALADLHKLIEYSETNPKGYVDKIPDFNNLYWDKNVNNDAKENLLKLVAGRLQFDPPAESPLATNATLEVWVVSGPKKD